MCGEMGSQVKKHICVGLMAHVDAGKTTLSEQLLHLGGRIRETGRVDHGDSFMDNDALERQRGITIFPEQASILLGDTEVILIDTPGHEDFAPQRTRVLSILDLVILVVSCADGIQSGTIDIWNQVREAGVPVLFFLNKADQAGTNPEATLRELREGLHADIIMANWDEESGREEIALRQDDLLEQHLEGTLSEQEYLDALHSLIANGQVFLAVTGSALLEYGTERLLECIRLYGPRSVPNPEKPFEGMVYRVRRIRDQRYVYVRMRNGRLEPRMEVETVNGIQKVHALYFGEGTKMVPMDACCGGVAVVTGIRAYPGEQIGAGWKAAEIPEPMMTQTLTPKAPLTKEKLLADLRELEEEEPWLCVTPLHETVQVALMGRTQQEVLLQLLSSRYQDQVIAGQPQIQYRESIRNTVTGIGHYEPLRHYAEVWLRLSPGAPGSGIQFISSCPPNTLEENWQRLIRTHVFERTHCGVLTGSPITDIQIELIGGRAHLKHTEGGDFREAVGRGIRQGLMQAENVLLEPFVHFECRMPAEISGRVTGELIAMDAQLEMPVFLGEEILQSGRCRMEAMFPFPEQFAAMTHGFGHISMRFAGYFPCKNQDSIVESSGYVPTEDAANPCNSVFCSHGAGFPVAWDHVREWAHLAKEME